MLALQSQLLAVMKDGVTAREVYQYALNYVKEKKPELEKYFVKSVGHGVGIWIGVRNQCC